MIPNAFTLGNLYCGFLSIGFAVHGDLKNAAILILIGMMLDSMDGRLARILDADSPLGKELDSLADIVTFGVAPSFLVYYTCFIQYGISGLFIAGIFPLFGAYRLARFNVTPTSSSLKHFTGVPITAAGGILALITLMQNYIPEIVTITIYVALSFLMVSKIKIPSFKSVPLPKYGTIVTIFLGIILIFAWNVQKSNLPIFMYIAIPLYILYILNQFVLKKVLVKYNLKKDKPNRRKLTNRK